MEHIALLAHVALLAIVVLLAGQAASIFLAWLVSKVEPITMEPERMVAKLPPPPEVNNNFNILYNMTKYRVISRVRVNNNVTCTVYYPQRNTLLGWKNIKQDGEVVKFPNLHEALKYVATDPLSANVELPPAKLSDQFTCWIYHFTARSTCDDLSEFLQPILNYFTVSERYGYTFIELKINEPIAYTLQVRPGDCVVLYPNGQVYVVPDVDEFPVSVLSTK